MTESRDENVSGNFHEDEDTILFGSTCQDVSVALGDLVDKALTNVVKNCPRVPKPDLLLKTLQKAHDRNLDIFDCYIERNVFSIAGLPPSRRKQIVQAFLRGKDAQDDNTTKHSKEIKLPSWTPPATTSHPQPKSKDEIPAKEELTRLRVSLKGLRMQLKEAKKASRVLETKLNQTAAAHSVAESAVAVLQKHHPTFSTDSIQPKVEQMLQGKKTLEELTERGVDLVKTLDQEKRERGEDEEEVLGPKKLKLTLEEQFEQERKKVTNCSAEDLKKLTSVLKEKNRE